ncbi:DUF4232 domain-containing protein [Oerskovia turbata]
MSSPQEPTPAGPRAQPVHVLVGVVFVVLVALAIWATTRTTSPAPPRSAPPAAAESPEDDGAPPTDPGMPTPSTSWGPLEVELEAIEGVESATVVVYDEYVPGIPLPAPAVTVDLESGRAPEQAQATVDAAHTLLLTAGLPRAPETTVVDTVPGTGGSLTVTHGGPGDVAVRDAVTLLDAGATSVRLTADHASVDGRDGSTLPAVAETARTLGRKLNSLGVAGFGALFTSSAEPVLPSAAAVTLLVAADARPEATQVVYEIRSTQGTPVPLLTVLVDGPSTPTADWLRAYPQGEVLDTAVAFTVHGDETSESGFVAGRDTVVTDPAGDQADAAAAAADGVAPCTGADLRAGITGFDAATGARFLTVTAENVSGRPCALDGRPGLSFVRASGTVPNVLVQPDSSSQNPTRIVVAAGATATSHLTWRAMSTANDPDVTTAVVVTTVPGATPAQLSTASVDGISSGADILEGATVTVAPWTIPTGWPTTP